MRIKIASVFVQDQQKALDFYTTKLGFLKKTDMPLGEFSWLTVGDSTDSDVELLLEPNANTDAARYQKAIYDAGIAATAFEVDDVRAEHSRLVELGVKFTLEPTSGDGVTMAVLDDSCGNLIQLYQG